MPLRVYNIGDSDNVILRKILENQTQVIGGSLSFATVGGGGGSSPIAAYSTLSNNTAASAIPAAVQSLVLGTPGFVDTGIVYQLTQTNTSYLQGLVQNLSNATGASADIVVNNNLGTANTYYANFGMNSSTFTGAGSFNLPNAAYLTSTSGDLVLGTTTANIIRFVVNSGTTDVASLGALGFTALSYTLSGNISSPAWTTSGLRLKGVPSTFTDTTSAGTVAAAYTDTLGGNTIAASSATTFTDYTTLNLNEPVAGTNVTFTNKWALGAVSLRVGTAKQFTVASTGAVTLPQLALSGNISQSAWTTNGLRIRGIPATLTDTTSTGTVTAAYTDAFGGNTIATSSVTTFTDYITAFFNEPVAGTNVTFTNKWGLGSASLRVGSAGQFKVLSTGVTTLAPTARASGVASYLTVSIPADTGITAATESIGYQHVTGTRTWATTGTVALQREIFFAGPTYASASASQTFTDAFNVYITPPLAGTNAIFTRGHSLGIVDSTSAASAVTGGLVVATTLGTAATSVGIGGGNVVAGGTILASTTTGRIGYLVGSGVGTAVTQLTSRATGVTSNTPTGAITMFSAAGSATAATFTVSCTSIAIGDTVQYAQVSGTNLYVFITTAIVAGTSFNVTFFTTGGTAVDAPVFNYTILKGSST